MRRLQILLLLSIALCRSFISVVSATNCTVANGEWKCLNGDCISINVLCDGTKHCRDGSDETRKFCKNAICTPLLFRCDYGACIPLTQLCDGVVDCADSSDENSEKCRKQREEVPPDENDENKNQLNCAGWGQMKCRSGLCISVDGKCNGIRDCDDGSDETARLCKAMTCTEKQFKCDYGACVPLNAVCNGKVECWDETDENPELCETNRVAAGAVTTTLRPPTIPNAKNVSTSGINTTTTTIIPILEMFIEVEDSDIDMIDTTTNKDQFASESITSQPEPITTTIKNFTNGLYNVQQKAQKVYENSTNTNNISKHIVENTQEAKVGINRPNIPLHLNTTAIEIEARLSLDTEEISQGVSNTRRLPGIAGNEIAGPKSNTSEPIYTTTDVSIPLSQTHQTRITNTTNYNGNPAKRPTHLDKEVSYTSKSGPSTPPKFATVSTTLQTTPLTTTLLRPVAAAKSKCNFGECAFPLICEISNPNSTHLSNTNRRISAEEGSHITFSCSKGYELEGAKRITCTERGWSLHNKPKCAIACEVDFLAQCTSQFGCLYKRPNSNSQISITPNFTESKVEKHTQIDFKCREGYELEGFRSRICTESGWAQPLPQCIKYCHLNALERCKGELSCVVYNSNTRSYMESGEYYWNELLRKDSHVEFNCDHGYKLEGEYRSTCTGTGWDNITPKCVKSCRGNLLPKCGHPLVCKSYDSKTKSYKEITTTSNTLYAQKSEIIFNCINGYQLQGAYRTVCKSFRWSHEGDIVWPKCIRACSLDYVLSHKNSMECFYHEYSQSKWLDIHYYFNRSWIPEDSYIYCRCKNGSQGRYLNCTGFGWDYDFPKCVEQRRP